jgi:hypothetical protein
MSEARNNLAKRPGRPQSIPPTAYGVVFRLHSMGDGCRKIVRLLEEEGVYTTRSSVSRLLLGHPPYSG